MALPLLGSFSTWYTLPLILGHASNVQAPPAPVTSSFSLPPLVVLIPYSLVESVGRSAEFYIVLSLSKHFLMDYSEVFLVSVRLLL